MRSFCPGRGKTSHNTEPPSADNGEDFPTQVRQRVQQRADDQPGNGARQEEVGLDRASLLLLPGGCGEGGQVRLRVTFFCFHSWT